MKIKSRLFCKPSGVRAHSGSSSARIADAIGAADAGAAQHAAAETGGAESAAKQGQAKSQAQTTASAAALEPVEAQEAARMELEQDEQPASVEPRVAVAAQPHKRRAVSAATAVGAVGEGARQL